MSKIEQMLVDMGWSPPVSEKAGGQCKHPVLKSVITTLGGRRFFYQCQCCFAMESENGWEETTGLCTVRDFAEEIINSGMKAAFSRENGFVHVPENPGAFTVIVPWGEMSFTHKGKKYSVEMVVTKVEDL